MLDLGADTTAKTFTEHTPLHMAAIHGAVGVAAELVKHLPASARDGPKGEWSLDWLDMHGRSPVEVALGAMGGDVKRCGTMLKALQGGRGMEAAARQNATERIARCAAAVLAMRHIGHGPPPDPMPPLPAPI